MSITDDALKANSSYVRDFQLGTLSMPPAPKLAVLACMDARLTVEPMLGLKTGDAHIIRNAGGIATEDALRSLIISHHLRGTQEFVVINHTDCGMLTFRDDNLERDLTLKSGTPAIVPTRFFSFTDLEQNVRTQVQKLRAHPWIPSTVSIRGFIYDVKTGRLNEVQAVEKVRRAA
jgi:carbonic anhydrase